MIQGILDNPNDMKFRTINKENKLVAENFLCIEFLKEIGFQ